MTQELFGEAGNVMLSIPNIQPKTTYKMCSSDLQKEYIGPTKSVHPTKQYKDAVEPNEILQINSVTRGGRPVTSISRPSRILLIFSSEPPWNPRPSHLGILVLRLFVLKSFQFLKKNYFFQNLATLGHKMWMD